VRGLVEIPPEGSCHIYPYTPAAVKSCSRGTFVVTDCPGKVYPHQGNINAQPFPYFLLVFHTCFWFNLAHCMYLLPKCQCFHLHLSYECIHVCLPLPAPYVPCLHLTALRHATLTALVKFYLCHLNHIQQEHINGIFKQCDTQLKRTQIVY